MSFKKKNVVLGSTGTPESRERIISRQEKSLPQGLRPSPLDGRLTTSTGTSSLDQYLAGHAGFVLGNSILVEEVGTTDFSGVLLKYYAAEGLVQGHDVHVLGLGEAWRNELPGLTKPSASESSRSGETASEKMKIAWRYETLNRNSRNHNPSNTTASTNISGEAFSHTFDLASRLDPKDVKGQISFASPSMSLGRGTHNTVSPLQAFLGNLADRLKSSSTGSIHRVIVPNILSPMSYDPKSSQPSEVLQFLHGLRGLLRQYNSQMTVIVSVSTTLHPRSSGLTRWIETLSDGVLEMIPLQQPVHTQPNAKPEDAAQGMLRVHRLPIYNEKGGGPEGKASQANLSFKLSSSSGLVIRPFSLPPVGEVEGDQGKVDDKKGDGLAF